MKPVGSLEAATQAEVIRDQHGFTRSRRLRGVDWINMEAPNKTEADVAITKQPVWV
jgi:hypothetical protein